MKLWMASDSSVGAWYNVDSIDPAKHGRAESGEILHYYDDSKEHIIAAYYWDSIYVVYRKYNVYRPK